MLRALGTEEASAILKTRGCRVAGEDFAFIRAWGAPLIQYVPAITVQNFMIFFIFHDPVLEQVGMFLFHILMSLGFCNTQCLVYPPPRTILEITALPSVGQQ